VKHTPGNPLFRNAGRFVSFFFFFFPSISWQISIFVLNSRKTSKGACRTAADPHGRECQAAHIESPARKTDLF
jgi:hypothetical protein